MNLKVLFFTILFAASALTAVMYRSKFTATNSSQSNQLGINFLAGKPFTESYTIWLQQEEQAIWSELSSKISLSHEECDRLRKQWDEDYKRGEENLCNKDGKNQAVSQATQNRIRTILNDFGLAAQQIPIVAWKDNSCAASTDTMLFINEREFCKLSAKSQKFIIGHEIQHYIHKDCSTNYIINRYYKAAQKNLPYQHPVNKLHRFQEIRADIKSALKSSDYAEGYVEFMEKLSKKRENNGISHPKNSLRLSTGKQIAQNLSRA
jgi:hypothetical protein